MISIIIPTLNEEKYLPKLLECIKRQTFRDYEVIVADNNSKDKTRQIAEEHGCKVVDGGLPGVGRNNGAKAAKGDYFMFFDADVAFGQRFIEKAFNEFQKRYLEVASCNFISQSKKYKIFFEAYNTYARMMQFTFRPISGGAFIFLTKRIFERIGGFDEQIKIGEDFNLIRRSAKHAKFGMLKSVKIYVSARRIEKEKSLNYLTRNIRTEIYRSFKGEIRKDIFKYDFGNYTREEQEFKKQKTKLNELIKKFKENKKRKGKDK
jgi:glycosyltransferase involved in cell wall biosynthesis